MNVPVYYDRKLVVVGDEAVGKSCLLACFEDGRFPIPMIGLGYGCCSIIDKIYEVDGKYVDLIANDTAGSRDHDGMRPLYCKGSHVVLICFAVDSPASLDNVQERWMSEVTQVLPGRPIILVACKTDLRNDPETRAKLEENSQTPVSYEEGQAVADQIGAYKYLECSAKNNDQVREVFEHAARATLPAEIKKKKLCLVL